VARPREGTAVAGAGHAGGRVYAWGCTEVQAPRGEGGVRLKKIVVCLAAMSATGTRGNDGRRCARRGCAAPARDAAREEQASGEKREWGSPRDGRRGRVARETAYAMGNGCSGPHAREWCRTSSCSAQKIVADEGNARIEERQR
jgi:hypothetical protein